ncbi:MAG: methyltransferase domain-containing protein [Planctomycetota bacterium]|nr:MAG: methyltransferase domain-containing protein [Planctomycetota bacterium]
MENSFRFKQFVVHQDRSAMKIGTDGILLGAWAPAEQPELILDIGTGTGLIALMMAQRFPNAIVDAVEVEPNAAEQAARNFSSSPWPDRLNLHHQTIQSFASSGLRNKAYSLIVSNPPWFADSLKSNEIRRNLARHTDSLSHDELLNSVRLLLHSSGRFAVVLPFGDSTSFIHSAHQRNLFCRRQCHVRSKPSLSPHRVLLEFETVPAESPVIPQELIIENEQHHDYTESFRKLTRDFYLRF